MKYLLILLLLFIVSCRSTKVKTESYDELKKELSIQIDSLKININKLKEIRYVENEIDSSDSEFEIEFKKDEQGEISLYTPNGGFSAIKKGDGSVTLKGKSKLIKSNKTEEVEKIKTIENKFEVKEALTEGVSRQSGSEAEKIKPSFWTYIPWWVYLIFVIIILFTIFRKVIIRYLKSIPFLGRFLS